jgi:hypothetical protein
LGPAFEYVLHSTDTASRNIRHCVNCLFAYRFGGFECAGSCPLSGILDPDSDGLGSLDSSADRTCCYVNPPDTQKREMFRVLQRMCRRIGVANRTEAIIWATKNGLL